MFFLTPFLSLISQKLLSCLGLFCCRHIIYGIFQIVDFKWKRKWNFNSCFLRDKMAIYQKIYKNIGKKETILFFSIIYPILEMKSGSLFSIHFEIQFIKMSKKWNLAAQVLHHTFNNISTIVDKRPCHTGKRATMQFLGLRGLKMYHLHDRFGRV